MIGFTSGWIAFLGAVTVGPIMVEAMLLYTSNYISSLTTVSGGRPVLTVQGYFVAGTLLLLFCTINVMGVRWLADINMLAVCWKLLVPAVTVVALIATSAHTENFSAHGGFMPFGWKGVFLALSSGGVIFAGLGFEQAVQLGGETRNPRRNIPFAIIGGMTVAIVLYIAPTGGVHPGTRPFGALEGLGGRLVLGKGVRALRRTGDGTRPGLARCPALHGRNRLARRHRSDLYGRERAPHLRTRSQRLYPLGLRPPLATRNAVPRDRVLVPLRPGDPPSVSGLAAARRLHLGGGRGRVRNGAARTRSARRQDPARPRPFRLPAASLLAPGTFVAASEILLFTGWAVMWKLIVAILIGFALLAVSTATDSTARNLSLDWRSAVWLWPYLLGMGAISYFSSFDTRTPSSIPLLGLHGPRNELTFGWDILAVAVFSLVIYAFAIRSRLPAEQALDYIGDPTVEEPEGIDARL